MKRMVRIVVLLVGILCLAVFVSVNNTRQFSDSGIEGSIEYKVGLEPSPWLTYGKNYGVVGGSTHAGLVLHVRSWSWLLAIAGLASLKVSGLVSLKDHRNRSRQADLQEANQVQ